MDRLACVDLPVLPLQLLLRRHPDWRRQPAAVVDRDKAQGTLLWVNEAARQKRILPGMRYATALSLTHDLRASTVDDAEVERARREILVHLQGFSAGVEPSSGEPGVFWMDAAGLAAFAVQGSLVALDQGVSPLVVVVMGMMTATGGGVIRDLLCGDRPMILSGQLYASTALAGSVVLVVLVETGASNDLAATIGFFIVLLIRGATLMFNIRMGPPGEFLKIGDDEPR